MFQGLVTALRTLSVLPVPGSDARDLARALPWFPLVGSLLGFMLWGLALGFDFVSNGWSAGAAIAVVTGAAVLTRGFHLDGLADWADGFGGGRDKAGTLAIMKDPHMGAFGVVALVLVLMAKWAACSRLVETGSMSWIVPACIVSRLAVAELAVCLPYARKEGGTAGPFVEQALPVHRIAALAWALVLVLMSHGLAGAAVLFLGWVMCRLLGLWFLKRVGGVTGDLLGACCELVETGILIACAAGGAMLEGIVPQGVFPT
jgi:adenosylcobinamide-GDP ribazoletransferase